MIIILDIHTYLNVLKCKQAEQDVVVTYTVDLFSTVFVEYSPDLYSKYRETLPLSTIFAA